MYDSRDSASPPGRRSSVPPAPAQRESMVPSASVPPPADVEPAVLGTRPTKRPSRAPVVLVVGEGDPMREAIAAGLDTRGVRVRTASVEGAAGAVESRMPDMLLLVGDATQGDRPRLLGALGTLHPRPTRGRLPIVVLEDRLDVPIEERLRTLRDGVVDVIERQASADAMAARIADVAWDVTHHTPRQAAGIEVTLDALAGAIRHELSQRVAAGGEQILAAPGREIAEAIRGFADRVRSLVKPGDVERARPMLSMHKPEPRLDAALLETLDDGASDALRGARLLLVNDDPGRADDLAGELRARGATVVVSNATPEGLARGRALDPEAVLVDSAEKAESVQAALARDPRLRWASVIDVRAEDVFPSDQAVPRLEGIAARIAPLRAAEHLLASRALAEPRFEVDLAELGPSRVLRALSDTPFPMRVTALEDLAEARADLCGGLVVGAVADGLEGADALAALLDLQSGMLRIERREAPAHANLLSPVSDTLVRAARAMATPATHATAASPATPAVSDTPPESPQTSAEESEDLTDGLAALLEPEGAPAPTAPPPPASRTRAATMLGLAPPSEPPAGREIGNDGVFDEVTVVDKSPLATARAVAAQQADSAMPQDALDEVRRAAEELEAAERAAEGEASNGTQRLPFAETLLGLGAPPGPADAPPDPTEADTPDEVARVSREIADGDLEEAWLSGSQATDAETVDAPPAPPPRAKRRPGVMLGGALLLGAAAIGAAGVGVWTLIRPNAAPEHAARPASAAAAHAEHAAHAEAPTAPAEHAEPAVHAEAPAAPAEHAEPAVHAEAPAAPAEHAEPAAHAEAPAAPAEHAEPAERPASPAEHAAPAAHAEAHAEHAPPAAHAEHAAPAAHAEAHASPDVPSAPAAAAASATRSPGPEADAPSAPAIDEDPRVASERLTALARTIVAADPERAVSILTRAAERAPTNAHPVEDLARLHMRRGNAAAAVFWATKYVTLRSRRASAHLLLGDARRLAGDPDGAQVAYEEALRIEPENRDAMRRLNR
jgi:DNA-binding response OmpR family regulator